MLLVLQVAVVILVVIGVWLDRPPNLLRSEEGYMADRIAKSDGGLVPVENHCPVCAAAQACQGLCRSELDIFRALLSGAAVERTVWHQPGSSPAVNLAEAPHVTAKSGTLACAGHGQPLGDRWKRGTIFLRARGNLVKECLQETHHG